MGPQAVTAGWFAAQARQRGTDGGQPQWIGVGLRQGARHGRAGQLPARSARSSQPHPEDCNLKSAVATVDRHAHMLGSIPTTRRATFAWAASNRCAAPTAQPRAVGQRAGPGPGHAAHAHKLLTRIIQSNRQP